MTTAPGNTQKAEQKQRKAAAETLISRGKSRTIARSTETK